MEDVAVIRSYINRFRLGRVERKLKLARSRQRDVRRDLRDLEDRDTLNPKELESRRASLEQKKKEVTQRIKDLRQLKKELESDLEDN